MLNQNHQIKFKDIAVVQAVQPHNVAKAVAREDDATLLATNKQFPNIYEYVLLNPCKSKCVFVRNVDNFEMKDLPCYFLHSFGLATTFTLEANFSKKEFFYHPNVSDDFNRSISLSKLKNLNQRMISIQLDFYLNQIKTQEKSYEQ